MWCAYGNKPMERGKSQIEWQGLAQSRIEDAEILLRNERFSAAYYLAGYAVECALKARIASLIKEREFPPDPKYVRAKLYTHSLADLLVAAELAPVFESKSKQEPSFGNQWRTVNGWSERSRYDAYDPKTAEDMLESTHGVVECIKRYW